MKLKKNADAAIVIGIFGFVTALKLYRSIRLDVETKDRISSHRTACIFLSFSIILIILISNLPVLDPYIVSGTWTVSANGTYSTNIVYSDATVLLMTGTWALIGTSTLAITDVDGTDNWTITQLDGNTMELSATIDGAPAVLSLTK